MIPRDLGLSYDEFRPYQEDVIQKFYSKWDDYNYFILQAPTGGGKSMMAVAIANMMKARTFISVKTKQLEEQYAKSFGFVKVVKGRANFPCIFSDNIYRCSEGLCVIEDDFECPMRADCLYFKQKAEAIESRVACFNYSYFLSEMNYVGQFTEYGERIADFDVFDEAHELDGELSKFVEVSINKKKFTVPDVSGDVREWIDNFYTEIGDRYCEMKEIVSNVYNNKNEKTKKLLREFSALEGLKRKVEFLSEVYDETWMIDDGKEKITFKPVWGRKFNAMLFKHAKKHLMMSATILDKDRFCDLLGLRNEEVYMLNMPSTFPSENRPIYVYNAVDMSHKKIDAELPRLVNIVDRIIEKYPDDKGLIHTVSFKIASYLKNNSKFKELMIIHETENRVDKLEEFIDSKPPRVLVSPSFTEGVDLKYRSCDYVIQAKAPYASLEDKIVRERLRQDRKWYEWQALIALVQGAGRGFRAEDDRCDVYWIDRWCYVLWKNNKDTVPEYFNRSVRWMGKVN